MSNVNVELRHTLHESIQIISLAQVPIVGDIIDSPNWGYLKVLCVMYKTLQPSGRMDAGSFGQKEIAAVLRVNNDIGDFAFYEIINEMTRS